MSTTGYIYIYIYRITQIYTFFYVNVSIDIFISTDEDINRNVYVQESAYLCYLVGALVLPKYPKKCIT